jgi:hypothetical protein
MIHLFFDICQIISRHAIHSCHNSLLWSSGGKPVGFPPGWQAWGRGARDAMQIERQTIEEPVSFRKETRAVMAGKTSENLIYQAI